MAVSNRRRGRDRYRKGRIPADELALAREAYVRQQDTAGQISVPVMTAKIKKIGARIIQCVHGVEWTICTTCTHVRASANWRLPSS